MTDTEYHGHMTMTDGSHIPLSKDDAEQLWRACEKAERRAAEEMPDEVAALRVMARAHGRLQRLGWRDAVYCPKDGSEFEAIEAGSAGIHRCIYQGEWPDGSWWIIADGDMWPSRPILFRPLPEVDHPAPTATSGSPAT